MCISSGGLSLFFSRAGGRKVSGSAQAAHGSSVDPWAAAATCLQRRLDLVTHNETDFAHSSASDQPLDAIEPLQAYVYLALTYGTATSWAPVHQPLWPFSSPCSRRYHQPCCHGVCVAKCPQPDISLLLDPARGQPLAIRKLIDRAANPNPDRMPWPRLGSVRAGAPLPRSPRSSIDSPCP